MKNKTLIIFIIFLQSFVIYSQETYMNNIVEKACECLSEIDKDEDLTDISIGLCVLSEATKYKVELLRDYNIDIENLQNEGEELGKMVGIEMFTACPEQIKRVAMLNEDNLNDQGSSFQYMEGTIKSITKSDFVIFSVLGNDGKTVKFYWLKFIDSDNDLQNEYESYRGKKVKIRYSIAEFYDPNLAEYRNYNLIESLNILD